MNYSRQELADFLGMRYVTGLLRGPARTRFTKLLQSNDVLRKAVDRWEELLSPLAWSLEPVQPSELVLPRIMRKIRANNNGASNASTKPVTLDTKARDRRSWFMTSAAAALAVISSIGWWQTSQRPPEVVTERVVETVTQAVPEAADIAVINSAEGKPIWITRIYSKSERIDIQVQTGPDEVTDKDYQLWALTDAGVPVSLGLLPKSDEISLQLGEAELEALKTTGTLAVSLEPLGGSPQAVPTGP
ncbi:MAG: hypothetical protein HKO58_11280, partial [Gammaproteobacteria bacterium]|nr:hypothetical protein [Gammaproteobacteria bacterium]